MVTSCNVEGLLTPGASTRIVALLDTVDEEPTIVVIAFAGDLSEEAHDTVARDVHRHSHVAHHIGHASATALHAVSAFIRVVRGNAPRIGGIELPIELAEVTSLERFNNILARQAAAPEHLHIRSVDVR